MKTLRLAVLTFILAGLPACASDLSTAPTGEAESCGTMGSPGC